MLIFKKTPFHRDFYGDRKINSIIFLSYLQVCSYMDIFKFRVQLFIWGLFLDVWKKNRQSLTLGIEATSSQIASFTPVNEF